MNDIASEISQNVQTHYGWIGLIGLLIGLIVRIVKDPKIPIPLPPRARPVLALVLGVVMGALESIAGGRSWQDALYSGAMAGIVAILVHVFGIESVMGGKEVPLPFLALGRPAPGSTPKPPPLPCLVAFGLVLGCTPAQREALIPVIEHAACDIAEGASRGGDAQGMVDVVCSLLNPEHPTARSAPFHVKVPAAELDAYLAKHKGAQ